MKSPNNLVSLGLVELLFVQCILSAPSAQLSHLNARDDELPSLLSENFPDPAILQDTDGSWYAFATAGNDKQVQVAKANAPEGPWTYLDQDLLPNPGPWTSKKDTWAPDVRRIEDGSFVMYYSGQLGNDTAHHCIGTATAKSILGPYTAQKQPLACHIQDGGAIDPSGYYDQETQKRYVVYKVDGNSIGHGENCGNTEGTLVPTPIMLQELKADGITPVGQPVQILDRTDDDGPLVEAPNLIKTSDGLFILFFSSHCFNTPDYDVKYATSDSIRGPYLRASQPLVQTGDYGLTAPGGATSIEDGGKMVFHANCPSGRCLFELDFRIEDGDVIACLG